MLKIKLKDIGVFYNGLKGKNLSDFSDNYPDKYIDFKSILNGNINISELPCVKINGGEQQNVVKRNDLLINMTSENIDDIGLCNIYCYDEKVFLNSFSQGFRVSDNYDPHYISYLLKSPNYRRKIKKQSQGITRINLAPSRLGNIDLLIHNYDKQKKIGSFFKELDELIELYNTQVEKVNVLYTHFINLLGNSDKTARLVNICNITTGKLNANAMVENGKYPFFTCAKDPFKIDSFAFDTEALLISGNGSHVGYINYYKGKFNAYQRTYVLDDFKIDIEFVKYYLNKILHKIINKEKSDSNIPYITLRTLEKINIPYPNNIDTKVVSIIKLIDEIKTLYEGVHDLTVKAKMHYLNKIFN